MASKSQRQEQPETHSTSSGKRGGIAPWIGTLNDRYKLAREKPARSRPPWPERVVIVTMLTLCAMGTRLAREVCESDIRKLVCR